MVTKQITTTKLKLSQKKEWRIAIAKDVLKQLQLKKLEVGKGGYLFGNVGSCPTSGSVKEHLKEVKSSCKCCAAGSMLLSFVKFHNKLDLSEIIDNNYYSYPTTIFNINRENVVSSARLGKFFSQYQLDLIETAFEGYQFGEEHLTEKDETAAEIFHYIYKKSKDSDYDDYRNLLMAIMKNVIKNEGIFCPAKDKLVIKEIKRQKEVDNDLSHSTYY